MKSVLEVEVPSEFESISNMEPMGKKTEAEELTEIISPTILLTGRIKRLTCNSSPQEILNCIKREMAVLENTGKRPCSLEKKLQLHTKSSPIFYGSRKKF